MEVVQQGIDSFLEEFELSLSEHPWDEAQVDDDVRRHPIPAVDRHVVSLDQIVSTHHDLFHTVIVEVLDNGSSIPISNDSDDDKGEELYDDSVTQHEQCIEIAPLVRTNLFTIFEEENSSVSDDSMKIQYFRPFPFQKTLGSRSETRLGISSLSSNTEKRKTRFHFLKKERPMLWIRRKSTREEAKRQTSIDNNGHGMPFYSVRSILNDLEELSVLSEKSGLKKEKANADSKGKRARQQIKNGSIETRKRKEAGDTLSTAQTQVTRNPCRLPLPSRRHSLSDVSASVSGVSEEARPVRCNPIRLFCRLRAGRSKRDKRPTERNDLSVEQRPKPSMDKKPRPHRTKAKNGTKITIVRDVNNTETSDRRTSVGTIPVSQQATIACEAHQKPRHRVQADFAEKEFQQYSYGVDMVTLLTETMMDMTSIIGGKMDRTCCTGKDEINQKEEVSIILVGSSESAGDLTLTSHEVHINQVAMNGEAKYGDESE